LELSETQAKLIEQQLDDGGGNRRIKRKIGRQPLYRRWPRKPISYEFAASIDANTRQLIETAIKLWQERTCIRFEENGPNSDRIEFFDGGGCSSFVGRTGGTQVRIEMLHINKLRLRAYQ